MNLFKNMVHIDLKKDMGLYNLTDEFFCVLLKSIKDNKNCNQLIVVDTLFEANKLYNSLIAYDENVYLFPMDDFLTSEALAISPDLMITRLETINKLNNGSKAIVITNLMGYLRFLPTKKTYVENIVSLKVGSIIEPSVLANKLISIGYNRDTIVNKTGEYGFRGYVIDVFPIDESNPVRIEFFDNEIESIRYFNPDDQKSIEKLDSIDIYPIFEFITSKDVDDIHYGRQKFYPLYEEPRNILDYMDGAVTYFKDYEQLQVSFNNILEEIVTYMELKDVDFKDKYMFNLNDIIPDFPIYYNTIKNYKYSGENIDFNIKTIPSFCEDSIKINEFIKDMLSNNKTIIMGLKEIYSNSIYKCLDIKPVKSVFDNISSNKINLVDCNMSSGFIYEDFVFISASELFNVATANKKYQTKYRYGTTIHDVNKLTIGDYVVHNIHGIGIYNGIKTLTLNDITKDYLEILYQGTDKIYIPVEKIALISKYSGREGVAPKINKLGGSDWQKTKGRVKQRVSDIADKLIKIYAERELKKGFAFSPDCDMSHDFENDFPYDLTPDQERAISQIKGDMESSAPMDRLLCGDVGFGKTEVAFAAAFKAMLDSKQVLFLCPTTILSNQHFENAIIRFKNYPVSIGLLNRFTSPKEVNRILTGLKEGTIDMVIGTHRLLSDDVVLKDLGLLIIDEEQRFGVMHKEKIKQYKSNVDVLTLTATPIPRTLQMSLAGIRSLSLIDTPPMNRYPVQTYVVEENKQILKDAIYKELSRNGQVFILYNKVQSIEEYANIIQNIAPDARIAIAHGQMNKIKLENTIIDFVEHKFDILVCTTIIETGIDIPNVNTLIIIDADRFGLSQLYQIRGRVGRSDRFAYAYLMYQPFKMLTETAKKRLNVIKEFTELGSGLSIATRDLSIRGAGDLLGSEQAGFIDSIGIDLYLKMLNDEIKRRNNEYVEEDVKEESKPLINVTTHISSKYVSEDDLKIEIHKKINSIDSMESLNSVRAELEDRFGKISEDISIYMYEELFEHLAKKIPLHNVHQNRNSIELVFSQDTLYRIDTEKLFVDAFHISNMFRFLSRGSNLVVVLDIIKLDKHPIFYLVELLSKVCDNFSNSSID